MIHQIIITTRKIQKTAQTPEQKTNGIRRIRRKKTINQAHVFGV
jgi:hypothetical protein